MAGIGFALQKLLSSKSITKKFYAFVIATFISSGPWLFSMFSMIVINFFSSLFIQFNILLSFRVTIIYIYALSIISSGAVQYLLTKYLADQHYIKKWINFYPALFTGLIIQFLISMIFVPLWFYLLKDSDLIYKVCTIFLFIVVSYIWLMMDFLSATKNYLAIVYSFLIGSFISILLTITGAFVIKNEIAILTGFSLGQLILFALLFLFAGKEFPFKLKINFDFLSYFRKYPVYLIIGAAYNTGLWTDKILSWIYRGHTIIYNYRISESYDFMIFLSYLSIIPALSVFLLKSETSFFVAYHKFYKTFGFVTLSEMEINYSNMKNELYRGLVTLGIVQFLTAAFFYSFTRFSGLFENYISLSLPLSSACSFQVLFLFGLVYLMYFNFIKQALTVSMLFLVMNFILNTGYVTPMYIPEGYGYLISAGFSFILTVILLIINIKSIIFNIVRSQIT
jgi:polysaccharide biosynthesis protein PelG